MTISKVRQVLSVRIIDRDKKPLIDMNGNKTYFTKWIEVKEINLGSMKCPNPEILEFKFSPQELESKLNWLD